jgi:hypothetical protein
LQRAPDATLSAWRAYWSRLASKAIVLMLRALDERIPREVGIDASEIESVIRQGRYSRRNRR